MSVFDNLKKAVDDLGDKATPDATQFVGDYKKAVEDGNQSLRERQAEARQTRK